MHTLAPAATAYKWCPLLCTQAVASVGAKVVAGFASLDRQLQKAGILPELKPAKIPAEVRDESGQLAADCAEVCRVLPCF